MSGMSKIIKENLKKVKKRARHIVPSIEIEDTENFVKSNAEDKIRKHGKKYSEGKKKYLRKKAEADAVDIHNNIEGMDYGEYGSFQGGDRADLDEWVNSKSRGKEPKKSSTVRVMERRYGWDKYK